MSEAVGHRRAAGQVAPNKYLDKAGRGLPTDAPYVSVRRPSTSIKELRGGHLGAAPARDWSGLLIPVASFLGMMVSAYLTWVHWGGSTALCTSVGDCEAVNSSAYADVSGVPVALLGFGMYLTLFALSVYGRRAAPGVAPAMALAIFGISLAGVLYSIYLTYIEVAVLHAICPWCVTSAVLITLIVGGALRDVLRDVEKRVTKIG